MPDKSSFRPDIEGMRAVAIGAVLLCHAGVPFLAGGYVGVDVFFVISGFLITRLLLGELDSTGGISLRRFYARRAKRLLPLTAVLLASSAPSRSCSCLPCARSKSRATSSARALYTANWHFASQSVDYFAQEVEPSPVLHLWSLAIEEQFYVVWPTLLLAATWLWRRRGGSVRPAIWVTLGVRPGRLARARHQPHRRAARCRLLLDLRPCMGAGARGGAGDAGRGAHPSRRGGRNRLGRPRARSSSRRSPSTRAPLSPEPPRSCPPSAPPALILAGSSVFAEAKVPPPGCCRSRRSATSAASPTRGTSGTGRP